MKIAKAVLLLILAGLVVFWLIGMIRNYMREAKLAQA